MGFGAGSRGVPEPCHANPYPSAVTDNERAFVAPSLSFMTRLPRNVTPRLNALRRPWLFVAPSPLLLGRYPAFEL